MINGGRIMGLFSNVSAVSTVQRIKHGETLPLSLSQLANIIINLPDAKMNLPVEQFNAVYALYKEFNTCTTKQPMDFNGYCESCMKIIKRFDALAPYEKYSGGNELEFLFLMDEIRDLDDKIAETEPVVQQRSDPESESTEESILDEILMSIPVKNYSEHKYSIRDYSNASASNFASVIEEIPSIYRELHPPMPDDIHNVSQFTARMRHPGTVLEEIQIEFSYAFFVLVTLFAPVEVKAELIGKNSISIDKRYGQNNAVEYKKLIEKNLGAEFSVGSDFMYAFVNLIVEHIRPQLRTQFQITRSQSVAIQKSIISNFSAYMRVHYNYKQYSIQLRKHLKTLVERFVYGSDTCEPIYTFKSGLFTSKDDKVKEKSSYVSFIAWAYTLKLIEMVDNNLRKSISWDLSSLQRQQEIAYSTQESKRKEINECVKLLDIKGLIIGSPFLAKLSGLFYDGDQVTKAKIAQELLADYTKRVLVSSYTICEQVKENESNLIESEPQSDQEPTDEEVCEHQEGGLANSPEFVAYVQETLRKVNEEPTAEEIETNRRKLEIRKKASYGKILQMSLDLTDDPSEQEQIQCLAEKWKDDNAALNLIIHALDTNKKTVREKLQDIDMMFSFY